MTARWAPSRPKIVNCPIAHGDSEAAPRDCRSLNATTFAALPMPTNPTEFIAEDVDSLRFFGGTLSKVDPSNHHTAPPLVGVLGKGPPPPPFLRLKRVTLSADGDEREVYKYTEDSPNPFDTVFEIQNGRNTLCLHNTGFDFPHVSNVFINGFVIDDCSDHPNPISTSRLYTFAVDAITDTVCVQLKSSGKPLHVKLELIRDIASKSMVELYIERGVTDVRPFDCTMEFSPS